MKVALITPFPPYRGGISKHSENLYKELSSRSVLKIYNYTRQYPNLFFPGKSQYLENVNVNTAYNSVRMIDSINPLTWKRVADDIIKNDFNKVIFRYWNPFFIPCYISIINSLRNSIRDIQIFAICDNIIPHEHFYIHKYLIRKFIKKLDGVVVLSDSVKDELLQIVKGFNYKKLFLPIVENLGEHLDYKFSKKQLKLDENKITFLFFGLIRRYKGLDILLSSLNKLNKTQLDKIEVIIVGEAYDKIESYKNILTKETSENVKWVTEYIPDNKINLYFSATDYVVLPYRSASQSAIIPMAYHFNKPVIVSNLQGLIELVEHNISGYIFTNNNIEELAEVLFTCIEKYNRIESMQESIKKFKHQLSTKKFVDDLIIFLNE